MTPGFDPAVLVLRRAGGFQPLNSRSLIQDFRQNVDVFLAMEVDVTKGGMSKRWLSPWKDLAECQPRGRSALCVWGCGVGAFPHVYADAGELFGLPGFVLLHHVQSLPHSAGGAAEQLNDSPDEHTR